MARYVVGTFANRSPESRFAFDASYLALRYTLMAIGSTALIASCLRPRSGPRRLFESKRLRFFGKYSYGLYVLHLIALRPMIDRFRGWIRLITPSKGVSVIVAGLLCFAIAVATAYLSYNSTRSRF